MESQLSVIQSKYELLENDYNNTVGNIQELDSKLKEAKNLCTSLEEKNKLDAEKKFSYLGMLLMINIILISMFIKFLFFFVLHPFQNMKWESIHIL